MTKRILTLTAAAFLLAGCTIHRFGDARIQNNRDFAGITPDRFYLKSVPLDRVAAHTLHVRDVPFAMYPTHVVIGIMPNEAEIKENPPWQDAELRIEFRTPEGKTFFSKDITLRDAQRGIAPGTAHQIELQFRPAELRAWRAPEDMPNYTSYDVVVNVLQPSRNKDHHARFYANIYVR
jgi:hypothetical protein